MCLQYNFWIYLFFLKFLETDWIYTVWTHVGVACRLSNSNFIWFTSIATRDSPGVFSGIFHASDTAGRAFFCETFIPSFGSISFHCKFFSASLVIKSFSSLASPRFDYILAVTFSMIVIVLPRPCYTFLVISSTASTFRNLSLILSSRSRSFFVNCTGLAQSICTLVR